MGNTIKSDNNKQDKTEKKLNSAQTICAQLASDYTTQHFERCMITSRDYAAEWADVYRGCLHTIHNTPKDAPVAASIPRSTDSK